MEDDAFFYTVMEPCQGGDLSQLSKQLPRDDVVTEDSLRESVSTPCGAAHMMSALPQQCPKTPTACQGGNLSQLSKKLPRDDVVTEDSSR